MARTYKDVNICSKCGLFDYDLMGHLCIKRTPLNKLTEALKRKEVPEPIDFGNAPEPWEIILRRQINKALRRCDEDWEVLADIKEDPDD